MSVERLNEIQQSGKRDGVAGQLDTSRFQGLNPELFAAMRVNIVIGRDWIESEGSVVHA